MYLLIQFNENATAIIDNALKLIEATKTPEKNLTIQDIVAKGKIVLETCNKNRMCNNKLWLLQAFLFYLFYFS